MEFIKKVKNMQACVNDWSAVIAVIAIQIPIVIGIIGTWVTTRVNAEKVKGQNLVITKSVEGLTTLVIDGFKSPPRPAPYREPDGANGEPGIE